MLFGAEMGVKASVATLFVKFDSPHIISGTAVTGRVLLMVNQEDVSCESIGCHVLGQECTEVHYTETVGSGDNRRVEHRVAHQRVNFMDVKFLLATVPSHSIKRGQYEYPFQFVIPAGAPASMHADNGQDDCDVVYSMEVWLNRPGFLRWDIKHKSILTVLNPPKSNSKVPLYIEPYQEKLFSCCCFRRGDILLGASVDSSVLSAGGNVNVKYAVHNLSTVRVKAIELSLTENLAFRAHGHHSHRNTRLCYIRIEADKCGLDLTPLSGDKNQVQPDMMDLLRKLSQQLFSDLCKVSFSVPGTAKNSYRGTLITISHTMSIRVITTFGTANPAIMRDVKMFTREIFVSPKMTKDIEQVPTSAPPDWAPVVAPALIIESVPLQTAAPSQESGKDDAPGNYRDVSTLVGNAGPTNGFDGLMTVLRDPSTYDQCGVLETWIANGNSPQELNPEQFHMMFKTMNDAFDQERFAEILADNMKVITCAIVARSVAACKDVCKREVAEKLLQVSGIDDKENAVLIKNELSPFQFMTVEKYL